MIQEEIARLTGKLVFQVDNRPLMAFEKRLFSVIGQLRELETLANKKFNIKVQLDSRTLREQLAKASTAKVTLKDVHVSAEALVLAAKRISEKLETTPITLNKIRVDISSLVAQKKLVRTLLGQMDISIPLKFQMSAADKALRAWKKETESKFKLHIDADISQNKFLRNVRNSLKNASVKLGPIKIDTPNIKLSIDRDHLKHEIRDVLNQIRRETTIRVDLHSSGGGRGGSRGPDRGARGSSFSGGLLGGGLGSVGGLLGGLGGAFAIGHLNEINQQMAGQRNAMTAVMGSEQAGAEQSQWVKDLSNKIGMDYRQVGPSYNKMLASGKTSGMQTESVQNIYQGVSEYGRVMGLDTESMKGSMKAIEQMMNKGQVMSEELKGQLSERMPGAESAMAEAAGFGTDEKAVGKLMDAMKKGTVKSGDVLEKFAQILAERARSGGALDKAMQSTSAQQARMFNSFSDSIKTFSDAGFDKGMGSFFKEVASGVKRAEPLIKALGEAFEILIKPVNALIKIGGAIGANWERIAQAFGLTGKQLILVGVAAGVLVSPMLAVGAAIGVAALAIQDLMTYADGGDSVFGRFLAQSPEAKQAFDDFVKQAGILGTYLGEAWDGLSNLLGGMKGLTFPEMFTNTMRELASIMKFINETVERFKMAGKYAEMKNPEGSWSRGHGGLQVDNMEASIRGPDWARMQMEEQINKNLNNSVNQNADGIPQTGFSKEALQEWATQMLSIVNPQERTNQLGDMTIVVDVKGGMITSENLLMSLEEPMKQVAMKAFGEVVNNERSTQSQVRK